MNRSTVASALLLTVFVSSLGGCKALLKKRQTDDTAPSATVAPAASAPPVEIAPVASAAPPAAADSAAASATEDAVPTPQDFEDEAFEKVTKANFKAQLATLTAAINKK